MTRNTSPRAAEMVQNKRLEKPIIILGAPRSGTTILFRCLALHSEVWHLPAESHKILEGPFHPSLQGYESNRVVAEDFDEESAENLRSQFYRLAINLNRAWPDPAPFFGTNGLQGRIFSRVAVAGFGMASRLAKRGPIRFVEKTPKNALRVPMLKRLFPDAFYVWITRNPSSNINSLIAAWRAVDKIGPLTRKRYGQFTYPIAGQLNLQDYSHELWTFALVPGWQRLKGRTLADVAAWQYFQCNRFIEDDLASVEVGRVFSVRFEDFLQKPVRIVQQIFDWAELAPSEISEGFARILPRVNDATSKARRSLQDLPQIGGVQTAIERLPELRRLQKRMGY